MVTPVIMCRDMADQTVFPSLYPCDFPVKVIGFPCAEFEADVLSVMRDHAGEIAEASIGRKVSAGGKYISLTIRIVARSREHLDRLYAELNARETVVMVI
jgi:putative lipoic acid-binding regulatory protein